MAGTTEFWHSPELPHLEARRSCGENSCYRPHTHDRFSIGMVDAGTSVFRGASGETVTLHRGDVILIPAHELHQCNPHGGAWSYQMIHADQSWVESVVSHDGFDVADGIRVFRNDALYRGACVLNERLFSNASSADTSRSFQRWFALATSIAPEHHLVRRAESELEERLAPVFDRLSEDDTAPSLTDLAALVDMNPYQLIRSMKRSTGLSPIAWRMNHRVTLARTLIRSGHSLSDTAYQLGFADQSHFHRTFRAHVAATPGNYRR